MFSKPALIAQEPAGLTADVVGTRLRKLGNAKAGQNRCQQMRPVDPLAAVYIKTNPGLKGILDACTLYQEFVSDKILPAGIC